MRFNYVCSCPLHVSSNSVILDLSLFLPPDLAISYLWACIHRFSLEFLINIRQQTCFKRHASINSVVAIHQIYFGPFFRVLHEQVRSLVFIVFFLSLLFLWQRSNTVYSFLLLFAVKSIELKDVNKVKHGCTYPISHFWLPNQALLRAYLMSWIL